MKNFTRFLLMLLMVTSAQGSFAQLGFGIKAGPNFSAIHFDDPTASYESRTGYHAGVFLRAQFNRIAVQPEVLVFTQRGEADAVLNLVDVHERFTYLSVPVIVKFYPIGGLNLQLGPQFGFLLGGEQEYETFLGTIQRDIKEAYKSNDVAVSFGGGYDFEFGLGLDLRYNIGIMDINNVDGGDEARTRNFMISLSWNLLGGD